MQHSPESQSAKILRYLQSGRSITPMQALKRFDCFRLGARVYQLRRDGHRIARDMIKRKGKTFASYRLNP